MSDAWVGLAEFVGDLRAGGVRVGPAQVTSAAAALSVGTKEKYWPMRLTLCSRRTDLPVFDAVYAAWFSGGGREESAQAAVAVVAESGVANGQSNQDDRDDDGGSAFDRLRTRDLRELSPEELAEVAALISRLRPAARRTLRRIPARTGRIDVGRTVRAMLRNGGEPVHVLRRRRSQHPRRLLLLVDISRSMRVYSDMLLRFAHAALAAGPLTTEVFALGTRHTRLTRQLSIRDTAAALRAVARIETDWDGGTELGVSLEEFLRRWGRHRAVRAATVVICSDGAEYGDQTVLPRQVARLARLTRRVLWVNPKQGWIGYRPVTPAHRESLRYVEQTLAGHSFEALCELAEVISQ